MAAVSLKTAPPEAVRSSPSVLGRRRPRRRKRWLALTMAGLALLYFAPSLIALTPLRDVPLRMVFHGIDGTIRSESASLGWFSAVEYRGVDVHDHDGTLVLRVPKITVERTPLQLLVERRRLGKVVVYEPALHFVARDGGSNVEEVLLPWWNAPGSGPVEMELEIAEGTINVEDQIASEHWVVTTLATSLRLTADKAAPAIWSVDGKVSDGKRQATFAAASATDSSQAIELKAERVPLAMFRWLAARGYPDLQLSGQLTCDLVWQRRDERLRVKQLTLDSNLGRISAQGDIPASLPRDGQALAALLRERFSVEGALDLAQLSRMLPKTLHIRPDTHINDGTMRFLLASDPAADEHRWRARIETGGLSATTAGKPLRWDKPVTIELAARETNAGLTVERLECSSDFLQLSGKGTADKLTADVAFNLDRLQANLGQLIDLGHTGLAGDGRAQIEWQRDDEGAFRVAASSHLTNFQLGSNATAMWREPNLNAKLQITGRMPATSIQRVDSAALRLTAAGQSGAADQLELHLREPIAAARSGEEVRIDRLPVLVHCSGNVAQWQARLAPWINISGLHLIGATGVHANLTWSDGALEVHSLQGAVQQRLIGHLTFALRGSYSAGDDAARLAGVEISSQAVKLRAAGQIDALRSQPELSLQGQTDRVRVTPEMAASWLKYIAPAVAEATEIQGELSLDLNGAKVPLLKPETADATGRLDIHTLQVTPGPTARAIILLAEQIRALVERRPPPLELGRNPTLLKISGQPVDFRMAGQRVHHQGMTMDVGNVTVRTHGWVAFDQSMGLVAEVPIKAEWFGRTAVPAGLKDQTLQIPIGGTLRRPQVDPRAMQQVVALFAQNAARDLIEDQINKQLDRLFER